MYMCVYFMQSLSPSLCCKSCALSKIMYTFFIYKIVLLLIYDYFLHIVKNLAPDLKYEFKVRAYKGDNLGKVHTVYAQTRGQQLTRVRDLHVATRSGQHTTTLKVSWLPPESASVKVSLIMSLLVPYYYNKTYFMCSSLVVVLSNRLAVVKEVVMVTCW